MPDLFGLLPRRVQWWYAQRWGEQPRCHICEDNTARWRISPQNEYVCMMCMDAPMPGESELDQALGTLYELEPADYLEERDPDA